MDRRKFLWPPSRTCSAATRLIAYCHGSRLEAIVPCELNQLWIEANDVTMALQHCAFEIVVEQHARHAAEEGECVDMPAREERHRSAEKEAQKDLARVAEHHHEGPECPLGAAD